MIEPWVPITVAAALLQCLRTALQRRLKVSLSTNGANFVRYLYGAPLAVVALLVLLSVTDAPLPPLTSSFLAYCLIGGVAQIVATRSEEHTSELQSLMRTSYAVFCLKKKRSTLKRRTT